VALFISTIPSSSPCDAGGSSVIYQVDACSGGRTPHPVFDVDGNGDIPIDEPLPPGLPEPPSGKKVDKILFEPLEIADRLYLQDSGGGITLEPVNQTRSGMFYWRDLGR
jgi:type IV pilus assembly protein PilY1